MWNHSGNPQPPPPVEPQCEQANLKPLTSKYNGRRPAGLNTHCIKAIRLYVAASRPYCSCSAHSVDTFCQTHTHARTHVYGCGRHEWPM